MNISRVVKNFAVIVIIAVAASLAFLHWPVETSTTPEIAAREYGERGDSSIITVEPFLTAQDYRSADALHARLSAYLDLARTRGWITPKTIIVFPEHVGTWLAAAEAPAAAYRVKSLRAAMAALVADDPIAVIAGFFASAERDRLAAAIFRSRGRSMADAYFDVFSALARDYGAVVVAGSIVLENPAVKGGAIATRRGPLYNVSAVFNADGSLAPDLVFKRRPIPSETPFISAGDTPSPLFSTPAGQLGVLVCADSWHPELYEAISGAEIIAVPAFLQADGGWTTAWGGYVTSPPDNLDRSDAGRLTEGDAWVKYAMPSRMALTNADAGATAFLRGSPWDLGADGRTLARARDELFVGGKQSGGVVSVVWR